MSDNLKVADFKHPADTDLEEIIEWLRAHRDDGNIHKLMVKFEDKEGRPFSRSINLANRDALWFMMREVNYLMNGDEEDG